MGPLSARCGNRCDLCPLFTENFAAEAASAIKAVLYRYHRGTRGPLRRYSRGCDGCLSEGHIARQGYPRRACTIEKGFSTCALCPELYCGLLEHEMTLIERALAREPGTLSGRDFHAYFRPFLKREALARLRREGTAE